MSWSALHCIENCDAGKYLKLKSSTVILSRKYKPVFYMIRLYQLATADINIIKYCLCAFIIHVFIESILILITTLQNSNYQVEYS